MSARYLVRFDDLCPTANWRVWDEIETLLVEVGITPLIAVVPDNQDPALKHSAAHPRFWDRVRDWAQRGWTIGMHGYQHRLRGSSKDLFGMTRSTEFAGVSKGDQASKIHRALGIFRKEGVAVHVWIAPAHSFDSETLEVLRETGINVISDGFALSPYRDDTGMFWIPQQTWKFRPFPCGLWTVCLHHNPWDSDGVARFRHEIRLYAGRCTSVPRIVDEYSGRSPSLVDLALRCTLPSAVRLKRELGGGRSTR